MDSSLTAPARVVVAGHELSVFEESPPMIAALLDDIRSARTRVWLEMYIFADDPAGRAVALALKDRVRAGVSVRVLYDPVGSRSTPLSFFNELSKAGVVVRAFYAPGRGVWRWSPLRLLNRRNHRKLVIIDDRIAYFGGMNIIDTSTASNIESPGWRDVQVRLFGPGQQAVAQSFERSWRYAGGERIRRRRCDYRLVPPATGDESIQFFDTGPGLKHARAGRLFTRLFRAARNSIRISMAYFVPVGGILKALLRAQRRGVLIQVVVPGQSDIPLVQRATRHLCIRLLRRRVHVHERQRIMLHSKVAVVDDRWTSVGSANLEARGLWVNLEFVAVVSSPAFAALISEIIEKEIDQSRRLTLRDCSRQGWWQRLLDRLAWSLRWWL